MYRWLDRFEGSHCAIVIGFVWILLMFNAPAGEPEIFEADGVKYHLLKASPEQVRIVWKGDDGKPMRAFPEALKYLKEKGAAPTTLMNGGIFEPGGIPSGLLVQESKELKAVNREQGEGNFYLHPNGVFLIGSNGAAVVATSEYPLNGVEVRCAVQSGPLLLRKGKVHPKFNKDSKWRLHRNGVGVTKKGEVIFIMTDFKSPKFPTLYEFANLFKSMGCDDALFLDGDLCQMKSGEEMSERSNRFGSIIAVVEETEKP